MSRTPPDRSATPAPAAHRTALALAAALTLAACGGGGGGATPTSGPLTVTPEPALAGSGLVTLRLRLPDDTTSLQLAIPYRTADLGSGSGLATGGAACGGNVDYVSVTSATVTSSNAQATVQIRLCPNATLEPNERFEVQFDWNNGVTRATAVILNDAPGGLNDTGATQCLDAAGALVACSASTLTGQDASTGRDTQTPTNGSSDGRVGFSFAAAGAGCLADRVTGLTWDSRNTTAATLADAQAAVAAANAAAHCGATDWRLPAAEELASLVDHGAAAAPRIDAQFAGTPSAAFWSREPYAGDTRASWVVDFASGAVAFETATNPLAKPAAVRPVRGGDSSSTSCTDANPARYVDHGNATVTDTRTGLTWMQCTDGLSGSGCAAGTATVYRSFADALARARAVNADRAGLGRGFDDWRVPNRAELASLVNRSCEAPAIQRTRFPGTPSLSTWSSTPARAGFAWYVDFNDGTVAPGGTSGDRVLRLVRAGQ